MLHLATFGVPIGTHLGGWRHPDAYEDSATSLEAGIDVARLAERGKFDLVFLADGNGVRALNEPRLFAANAPANRPGWFEPTTFLSAVAMKTQHIGLVATATTTFEEPYILARKFASLDRISKGRAGWNVVTTSTPEDALNFSRTEHVAREERYERAREFVDVVFGLWDSWSPDAFVQNKATGQYLDPSKVHTLYHHGKHFAVKGPLNIARSPQGRPLVFNAGQSEDGKEMSARTADCSLVTTKTKAIAAELYRDIKGRMAKYGRAPDSLKIFPMVSVYVGRDEAEVETLIGELGTLIDPCLGLDFLSQRFGMDLSNYPLDGPLPKLEGTAVGYNTGPAAIAEMAEREQLTIRQTYEKIVPTAGNPMFKGTASAVADQIEDWYRSKACDGFVLTFPVMPRGLGSFVELVVPELQRRGIFRKEYEGQTLRENMGLPQPPSRFDG